MEKITLTKRATVTGAPYEEVHEVQSYADVSDGYHTIQELYEHRIALYIALCRVLKGRLEDAANEHGHISDVAHDIPWRAKLHYDSTGYDGWFILGIGTKHGEQITYHIPLSRWDETDFATTFDKASVPFDGHTSADVLNRLKDL